MNFSCHKNEDINISLQEGNLSMLININTITLSKPIYFRFNDNFIKTFSLSEFKKLLMDSGVQQSVLNEFIASLNDKNKQILELQTKLQDQVDYKKAWLSCESIATELRNEIASLKQKSTYLFKIRNHTPMGWFCVEPNPSYNGRYLWKDSTLNSMCSVDGGMQGWYQKFDDLKRVLDKYYPGYTIENACQYPLYKVKIGRGGSPYFWYGVAKVDNVEKYICKDGSWGVWDGWTVDSKVNYETATFKDKQAIIDILDKRYRWEEC